MTNPEIYQKLGINTNNMGAIMARLDVEPIKSYLDLIPESALYYSPTLPFVKGKVGLKPHITIKYGMLAGVTAEMVESLYKNQRVQRVDFIQCEKVTYFDNLDNPYIVCVLAVQIDPLLKILNEVAGFLPNINTYVPYKAHVTLAYLKRDWGKNLSLVSLEKQAGNIKMRVNEIVFSGYGAKEEKKLNI